MERILAAVDGSETALKAVDFAANLAAQTNAELTLITVVEEAYVGNRALKDFARAEHLAAAWGDLSEARATEILIAAHERAAAYEGVRVHKEWRSGTPAAEIARYAKEKTVDLIVVGNTGHGRLAGVLLGSVAFKLLGATPCPLTVVR
jgi:nucleotide-binding universal stress UspA family protein